MKSLRQVALWVFAVLPLANSLGENTGVPVSEMHTTECQGTICKMDDTALGDVQRAGTIDVSLFGEAARHFKRVKTSRQGQPVSMLDTSNVDPEEEDEGDSHGESSSWYGTDGDATMTLVSRFGRDNKKLVFGNIHENGTAFHISPGANGDSVVTYQRMADFPSEADPLTLPTDLQTVSSDPSSSSNTSVVYDNGNVRRRVPASDDGSVLDIMTIWTKEAECRYSNMALGVDCTLTNQTEDKMIGLIELAVAETNTAFDLSGIETQLRLVHAYRHVSYTEQTSGNPLHHALTELTEPQGEFADVHLERARSGADIVSLLMHNEGFCGLGWLGPHTDYMFSVSSWQCATGHYSYGHEISHNLGAGHDRGVTNECSAPGSNYGYRDKAGDFRTIMAYNCDPTHCDKPATTYCERINRFSNTKYLYNGKAVGDSKNDNAAQISSVLVEVAGYFPSQATPPFVAAKEEEEEVQKIPIPKGCKNRKWMFVNRKGKIRKCSWVRHRPEKRCKKVGTNNRTAQRQCRQFCKESCVIALSG